LRNTGNIAFTFHANWPPFFFPPPETGTVAFSTSTGHDRILKRNRPSGITRGFCTNGRKRDSLPVSHPDNMSYGASRLRVYVPYQRQQVSLGLGQRVAVRGRGELADQFRQTRFFDGVDQFHSGRIRFGCKKQKTKNNKRRRFKDVLYNISNLSGRYVKRGFLKHDFAHRMSFATRYRTHESGRTGILVFSLLLLVFSERSKKHQKECTEHA